MPLTNVTMTVVGETVYARGFDMLARESADLSKPLENVGQILIEAVGRQFDSEGSAEGQPWRPLNPAYERWKRSRFGDQPILVATGKSKHAALDERSALTVTPRQLVYAPKDLGANEDEILARHQGGTGKMPARPIVQLSGRTRREIDREFAEWLAFVRRRTVGVRG